jgi:predicted transcriptional regulator
MGTAVSTSLKLDPEIKERVSRLAEARRRSAHWIMREAIEEYVAREERREQSRADARNPEFVAEYRRQAEVLAASIRANPEAEAEYWREAEAVQADEGWV